MSDSLEDIRDLLHSSLLAPSMRENALRDEAKQLRDNALRPL